MFRNIRVGLQRFAHFVSLYFSILLELQLTCYSFVMHGNGSIFIRNFLIKLLEIHEVYAISNLGTSKSSKTFRISTTFISSFDQLGGRNLSE